MSVVSDWNSGLALKCLVAMASGYGEATMKITSRRGSLGAAAVLALAASLFAPEAQAAGGGTTPFAQAGRLGLGLGGSSLVSGLSAKYYLSGNTAVQAEVGAWAGYGLLIGVDGIVEMPQLWTNGTLSINWNVGAGATAGTYSYSGYGGFVGGVSGIVGLGFQLAPIPLEFVTEFRPTFLLGFYEGAFPLYWGGGGALRYYF